MNRIIIIDDRQDRDKPNLTKDNQDKLDEMSQAGKLVFSMGIERSLPLESSLLEFSLIAIHRTYLVNNDLFNAVLDYIKKTGKYLIIFSGGIGQSTILQNGHMLSVDASEFYSEKLPSFLYNYSTTDMKHPLLKYMYGKSWRLTLLLEYRYYLWTYDDIDDIDNDDEADRAEKLQRLLWDEDSDVSIERVNEEICVEIDKKINS